MFGYGCPSSIDVARAYANFGAQLFKGFSVEKVLKKLEII